MNIWLAIYLAGIVGTALGTAIYAWIEQHQLNKKREILIEERFNEGMEPEQIVQAVANMMAPSLIEEISSLFVPYSLYALLCLVGWPIFVAITVFYNFVGYTNSYSRIQRQVAEIKIRRKNQETMQGAISSALPRRRLTGETSIEERLKSQE